MKTIKDKIGFYHEVFFDDILQRERKRTERTQQPFTLIMVAVKKLLSQDGDKAIKNLSAVFNGCFREIDIRGWYRTREIIGIICPDVAKKNVQILKAKLETSLEKAFPERFGDDIIVSYICFPDAANNDSDNDDVLCMYPEFKSTRKKQIATNAVKRSFDLTVSLSAFIFLLPLFILIAALIKISSPGPIFFRQKRVGFGGRQFTFFKFRSMTANNDTSEHREFMKKFINGENPHTETTPDAPKVYKIVNDKRVTPIGRFLRKTSLDELPQLLNVIIGDMSLVGPRPPIPYEVEEYRIWHRRRVMEVKPGITGHWQVNGRSKTNFETMVRMDVGYIKTRSLWVDLKLLLKTPLSLFKGAH